MSLSTNLTTCPVCATCDVCPKCATCPTCFPDKKSNCPKCNPNESNPFKSIYTIFHFILTLFAIYLSFKCNKGFDFFGFITAIFFPYIYIIYKYATSENFCDIQKGN